MPEVLAQGDDEQEQTVTVLLIDGTGADASVLRIHKSSNARRERREPQ